MIFTMYLASSGVACDKKLARQCGLCGRAAGRCDLAEFGGDV